MFLFEILLGSPCPVHLTILTVAFNGIVNHESHESRAWITFYPFLLRLVVPGEKVLKPMAISQWLAPSSGQPRYFFVLLFGLHIACTFLPFIVSANNLLAAALPWNHINLAIQQTAYSHTSLHTAGKSDCQPNQKYTNLRSSTSLVSPTPKCFRIP